MKNPEVVDLLQENRVPTTVTHQGVMVKSGESRSKIIADLIQVKDPTRVIIFCNTKNEASKVALYLSGRGVPCEALHSDLSQFQREQAMRSFRKGTTKAITATDVAARGIDVPDCDLVIHSEPPNNGFEYYIHRSGRTGRAGKEGLTPFSSFFFFLTSSKPKTEKTNNSQGLRLSCMEERTGISSSSWTKSELS